MWTLSGNVGMDLFFYHQPEGEKQSKLKLLLFQGSDCIFTSSYCPAVAIVRRQVVSQNNVLWAHFSELLFYVICSVI